MKLRDNLHRIGNDLVAVYLVEGDDGITLIDAGLSGHWKELRKELRLMGRNLADIRGVVLTHGDTDHLGFAERLRRETGAPVYVHAADADRALGRTRPSMTLGPRRLGALLRFFVYGARKGGLRTTYLTEVTEVADGDILPLPGAPEIVAMPGHSPGSIAVFVAAVDAVFVGDALTTRHVLTGVSGPQPAPFTDDPEQALESLERLAPLAASWVLPGHGTPWRVDPAEVAGRVRAAAQPA